MISKKNLLVRINNKRIRMLQCRLQTDLQVFDVSVYDECLMRFLNVLIESERTISFVKLFHGSTTR